jgi:hypothetical protein
MAQQLAPKRETHRVARMAPSNIKHISRREGSALLDRQARKYLDMSGDEFRRQYHAGLLDAEDSRVIRVSFLLPLAKD